MKPNLNKNNILKKNWPRSHVTMKFLHGFLVDFREEYQTYIYHHVDEIVNFFKKIDCDNSDASTIT